MEKYYFLTWKEPKGAVASAFAPDEVKVAYRLIRDLEGIYELPFELKLVKLSVGKVGLIESNDLSELQEIWYDYQINSLAWPIVSERLKVTIEKYLTGKEGIDWITCYINSDVERRKYYILRFNKLLDVLDMKETMFGQDISHVINPCFSLQKIDKYTIFYVPSSGDLWKISPGLCINETLKKAMQKEKLTGIGFEKALVA